MALRVALLAPSVVAIAALGGLAWGLEHGRALGASLATLEAVGRAYFAVLVGAPLVLYPLARSAGASPRLRVVLSLLPATLWGLTEVGVRLRWHSLAESFWLVMSPFALVHALLLASQMVAWELVLRIVARVRGESVRILGAHPVRNVALAVAAPVLVGLSIVPFLVGYRALFQSDLLPIPEQRPGPVEEIVRAHSPARAPNVVFILSDDHRFDALSHEGHPFVETPAIDRLAEEGVRFTRAFVTSSLCSPSRASFLTGAYPHRHGVWNNFTPWDDGNRTFLEYLGAAGYATAFIGKWHMPGGLPALRNVDHFVTFMNVGGQGIYEWCPLIVDGVETPSTKRYIAEELTDRAIAWVRERGDAPFALHLSHKSVHAPFLPDEPERGIYADQSVELPPGAHPWTHLTNAQYTHFNFNPLDASIRKYMEAVTSMDREIGRFLDALDELGIADRTIVIYTSDNGYQWGEHGLVDKRWAYEESIRIPMLVRMPGRSDLAGSVVDRLVTNVDVAPTLLDAAGLAPGAEMQGASWLPLLDDPTAPWRDAILYTYYFEPPYPTPTSHVVRTERFKYIDADGLPPELYDLDDDPREQNDRAADLALADERMRLVARLDELRREIESGP